MKKIHVKNNFNNCLAKKYLYIKEKKCFVHFSYLKNNEKLVMKNYGEPLKYIFQTRYKFEKLKKNYF